MVEIDKFAGDVRSAARAGNGKLRLATHNDSRKIDYRDLYVTPSLTPIAGPSWFAKTPMADIGELVVSAQRFVILGDPGAGKSTLAAKLAHNLAVNRIPGLTGQVPLLLRVREHTGSLRIDHESLLHLEAACRRPGNITPPQNAVEYLLLATFRRTCGGFAHRFPLAPARRTRHIPPAEHEALHAMTHPVTANRETS